jgi:antibiotic biosynthesis monooxygenase (ABM) superfamily enzyme
MRFYKEGKTMSAETNADDPAPSDHKAESRPHGLPRPCRFRLTLLLILAVYPVITTLLYILMPLTSEWETWHRTLIITPIMVTSIVFIVTPAIQRHLGWYVLRMPRP